MQAQDIMTRRVITVGLATQVPEIADLLITHQISGVPVVDVEKRVLGIVTESDLCRRVELGTEKHRGRWIGLLTRNGTLAADYVHAFGRTAGDVMTRKVVTVPPDLPLSDIADAFETYRIKRVPVVDNGKLVGIVSRANLIQALAAFRTPAPPTSSDRIIRETLLNDYARQPWGKRAQITVVVNDGVVHLWGLLDTEAARSALRVAAETIPGVVRVEDHTSVPAYS